MHQIVYSSLNHNMVLLPMPRNYWENPEYWRAKSREYYHTTKTLHPEQIQKWKESHRKKYGKSDLLRIQKYMEENKERIRIQQNKQQIENRVKAVKLLGGVCTQCGYNSDVRALQIDKISGGHKQTLKEKGFTSNHQLINWIIENVNEAKKEWQVLCANCNMIKKITNREMKRKYNYESVK